MNIKPVLSLRNSKETDSQLCFLDFFSWNTANLLLLEESIMIKLPNFTLAREVRLHLD